METAKGKGSMSELIAQAEALEWALSIAGWPFPIPHKELEERAAALRAQAQAEQPAEPVAKVIHPSNAYPFINAIVDVADLPSGTKLYAHPDPRIAALEADLTQAVQMYTDAAGERDKALADLAAAQAERDALRERANALLHQIDIGDYVDSEGHALKNNIAVLTLMKALTNV